MLSVGVELFFFAASQECLRLVMVYPSLFLACVFFRKNNKRDGFLESVSTKWNRYNTIAAINPKAINGML